jgi:hypothetical protein
MSTSQIDLGKRTLHGRKPSVDANASVDSLTTRFAVEAREAFQQHLQELFQEEKKLPTRETDPPALAVSAQPPPLPMVLPEEELETLSAQQATTHHDWYAKGGEQQCEARGLYQ